MNADLRQLNRDCETDRKRMKISDEVPREKISKCKIHGFEDAQVTESLTINREGEEETRH